MEIRMLMKELQDWHYWERKRCKVLV